LILYHIEVDVADVVVALVLVVVEDRQIEVVKDWELVVGQDLGNINFIHMTLIFILPLS
jgi:hypothetical protein